MPVSAQPLPPLRGSADYRASADALQAAIERLTQAEPELGAGYDESIGWYDAAAAEWSHLPVIDLGDILLERLPRVRPELAAMLAEVLAEAAA